MPPQHLPIVKSLRLLDLHERGPRFSHLAKTAMAVLSCAFASVTLALLLINGCGQTGTPQAPSLKLPDPVTDLAASRVADHVALQWTMPRRTTDKMPLKGLQPVQICRRIDEAACLVVGTVSFEFGKPASYDDKLPPDLTAGSPQLLTYSVDVLSLHGRSAGASNIAYAAAGSTPPAFIHASGMISANGVILEWQPASLLGTAEHKVKIERTLLSVLVPAKSEGKPSDPMRRTAAQLAKEQTLAVRLPPGADPGKALDPDAAFDQRYSYRISRVATVRVGGKSIDIAGPASAEILVDTKDVFPPAAPTGLAVIDTPGEGAIDLSWAPNTESDLAGYAVYRSEGSVGAVRISPTGKPVDSPAFRDTTAQPGHEYVYSVTAVDHDGNESAPSAGVKESLPAKP